MKSDLATKLGIKPGHLVGLVDPPPGAARVLGAQFPPGMEWVDLVGERRCDVLLYWPRDPDRLSERFRELQYRIVPDGAIWAVMPKKKYARSHGIAFTWEQMQAAGLQTDLVDNKVASISEEEYGTRFVIRKDARDKYAL